MPESTGWAFPNWPPYAINGWFIMPTFPSRWYHPVLGSRNIESANQFMDLGRGWFPTPGLADMARTETEAELVITHDINLVLAHLTEADEGGDPDKVNRRSASEQALRDGHFSDVGGGFSPAPQAEEEEENGSGPSGPSGPP